MTDNNNLFDVIIAGGSYAGLSAAMALGRSRRKVLIIDSGRPCNRQTPHSHNFLTQDGENPQAIAARAKAQVLQYDTVSFLEGTVKEVIQKDRGAFEVTTEQGLSFTAARLLFATGISDEHQLEGAAACWGISVLHCPYCHGYEAAGLDTGIVGNGDPGFEFARLISNWTDRLTLFTNGPSTLNAAQSEQLAAHNIAIVEQEIAALEHTGGQLRSIVFTDNSKRDIPVLYLRPVFKQHCDLPRMLGCTMTEQGYILVDDFGKTSVPGIYAAGDNTTMFRSVAIAVAAGNKAGAAINRELLEDRF